MSERAARPETWKEYMERLQRVPGYIKIPPPLPKGETRKRKKPDA